MSLKGPRHTLPTLCPSPAGQHSTSCRLDGQALALLDPTGQNISTILWQVAITEGLWAETEKQGVGIFRPGALIREGGSALICTSKLRFHQSMSELTRPGELVSRGGGRWGVLLRGASLR